MRRLLIITLFLCVLFQINVKAGGYARPEPSRDYLNSVKITFLSWLSGSTKVSYERAFPGVRQSGEICSSLICAGYDKYENDPLGFTVRYGHKFFLPGEDKSLSKTYCPYPEGRTCVHT